jgi:hypothetical protein
MAGTVIDLLANNASGAKKVLENYRPVMTRAQYLEMQESRFTTELYAGK